ncbi:hypothetical protein SDC9_174077 [bioreactor metagenome]|uniref:Uncharacterized protein n=1 Tax=bioreactor metagenome TaxID=1076179 RepID=A0A645GLA4_9ZZZZ
MAGDALVLLKFCLGEMDVHVEVIFLCDVGEHTVNSGRRGVLAMDGDICLDAAVAGTVIAFDEFHGFEVSAVLCRVVVGVESDD